MAQDDHNFQWFHTPFRPVGLSDLMCDPSIEQDRLKARERAIELLRSHLTPEQLSDFDKNKCFRVQGSQGGLYEINVGRAYNVKDLNSSQTLCASIGDFSISVYDSLLAQMLMIETNEPAFLRIANSGRMPEGIMPDDVMRIRPEGIAEGRTATEMQRRQVEAFGEIMRGTGMAISNMYIGVDPALEDISRYRAVYASNNMDILAENRPNGDSTRFELRIRDLHIEARATRTVQEELTRQQLADQIVRELTEQINREIEQLLHRVMRGGPPR